MGPIGVQEMIGILLIALLLFGPKKLPELGRMLGKGLREFRRMKNEVTTTFETHLQELEREARLAEANQPKSLTASSSYSPATRDYSSAQPDYSSTHYSYPYEQSVPQTPTYEATAALEPATGSVPGAQGLAHELSHVPVAPKPALGSVARNGAAPVEEEHPA